ncbi:MAG: MarR family transcriptional regulator [Saprospiraceae bacterium]|jgi:DNA-binding MarR family transcriptional regulator|nr:MarR family transcriptional regulator [Saprospiraceae bacterium]
MKIEDAIKQKRFTSEFHKAHINVLYTAAWFSQQTTKLLKPFNISWQQFNILRILRGMHPQPATVKELAERMIDKMSNASRLVEKLKQKGLVDRYACEFDRRRVDIIITEKGHEVLASAIALIDQAIDKDMRAISSEEATLLNTILDKLRD